jgi:hypothetical protein
MARSKLNTVHRLAALALCLMALPLAAQNIYKTVDENGNTVFTDQRPSEDAEPLQLRELTVVEPVEIGDPQALTQNATPPPDVSIPVRIISPSVEETIWNTAFRLDVSVEVGAPLPSGARLAYLIDGTQRALTREQSVSIEEVWRGEHQLQVELRAEDGRVLGSSAPVRFFMQQASALNRPRGRG